MFLVLELGVHDHSKDLGTVSGLNDLSLNSKGLQVGFVHLIGEMNNCRLFCFKCRTTSPFLVQRFVGNCFDTAPVTLCRWAGDPCYKIIHKGYGSSVVINPPLHQICIEEEEEDWREGRALRKACLWQGSNFGVLPVNLDQGCTFRAEGLRLSAQFFWYPSGSYPLDQSFLIYPVIGSFDIEAN